jgi:KUP system potassium uptake protein
LLVVSFQSSDALAGAYGIAVSATMLLGGALVLIEPETIDAIPRSMRFPLLVFISFIDLAFFSSNVVRAFDTGWIPLAMAALIFAIMWTWSEGRCELNWIVSRQQLPLADFQQAMQEQPPERAAGTAVYLTNEASTIPMPLVQQLKFHRFLHQQVIILTFSRTEVPRLSDEERIRIEPIADGLVRVTARYGFMERPDTLKALRSAASRGLDYDPYATYYVVGRTTPIVTNKKGVPVWRKRLYALMARNTRLGYEYFGVPTDRLLEIGTRVEI